MTDGRGAALSSALFALALCAAAALGYLAGEARAPLGERLLAGLFAPGVAHAGDEADGGVRGRIERAAEAPTAADGITPPGPLAATASLSADVGRLRAEILRLRVLFRRLAEVAELDDGEFDLELAPRALPAVQEALETGALAPLEPESAPIAFALDLSKRALDPISEQATRMRRIFDERRAAFDRRLGGGLVDDAVRTSGFGYRRDPFSGRRQLHRGADYAARAGAPIRALADGIVTFAGVGGGYGNLVEIEHDDGYRTRYAHNEENLVAVGRRVAKGEVVATLGSSGRSTAPHVHVEVHRHGAPLDPAVFIR